MPPSDDLPGFLHHVAPILDRWGYLAVAGTIGVESFGVPTPGQTVMVAAAVYAGAGRLNIFAVAAIAFVAAVMGDNVGYWIGVRGGRRVVHRFGKYVFLTPERLEKAEAFFNRRGSQIVIAARFIDGLRQFNGLIAGITAMPWRKFLLYNTVGAAIWVGWWTTVAYFLGNHLVVVIEHAHKYKWWAIAVITVAVLGYIWLHWRRRKNRQASAAAAVTPPAVTDTSNDPARTDSQS